MDETLIRQAAAGDQNAFAALLAAYQKPVYNLALRMTGSPDDALDLSQEAFLRAWRGLSGYRFDASFSTWLYRLTGNVCIDFLRRRKPNVSLTSMAEQGFDPPDAAATPEESALRREDGDEVRRAIALLPEDMRTVLILSALEGKRYEEIADITGVAVGTVKSRLNRARLRLSEILAQLREPSAISSVQPGERRTQP